jgi:hypothetical protein
MRPLWQRQRHVAGQALPSGAPVRPWSSAIQTVPRRRSQASDFDPRQRSIDPSQPLGSMGFGSEFHRGQCLALGVVLDVHRAEI